MDGRILSFDRSARLCGGELAIRRCVAAVAFAPIADLCFSRSSPKMRRRPNISSYFGLF
jgi:hypothetical protein